MAEYIIDKIAYNGDVYKLQDNQSGYITNPGYACSSSTVTAYDGSVTTFNMGGMYGSTFTPLEILTSDTIIVTFNNTEYELPLISYGGASYYGEVSDNAPDFTHYPCLITFLFSDTGIIITQSAGTYSVKIEGIVISVTVTPCFKKAVNSASPILHHLLDGAAEGSLRSSTSAVEGSNYTLGSAAVSEGDNTEASGDYSHAEGSGSTASAICSHAEGYGTTASGSYSHAANYYTTANHRSQYTFGEYNILDPSSAAATKKGNYIEIVGNGTSNSARSNARTLDWNGNEVLAGKLTLGAAPTANMDAATKQYVDNSIPTVYSSTNTGGYLTMATLPIYNGTVE